MRRRPSSNWCRKRSPTGLRSQQSRLNIDSNKLNLVGIKNALKPTLQAFAELTNNGLTGPITAARRSKRRAWLIWRAVMATCWPRCSAATYPNYTAGIALNIPLRNRAAQSDYVTSELELRQSELGLQQNINQVRVDVQNAVIGLQQARARYAAAVKASAICSSRRWTPIKKDWRSERSTAYQIVLDQQNRRERGKFRGAGVRQL